MNLRRRAALGAAITAATVAVLAGSLPAQAQQVLNLYSARHYQTDDALYAGFTDKTGIEINRRSEEHTSELQSLMRISSAVFCLKKKTQVHSTNTTTPTPNTHTAHQVTTNPHH